MFFVGDFFPCVVACRVCCENLWQGGIKINRQVVKKNSLFLPLSPEKAELKMKKILNRKTRKS